METGPLKIGDRIPQKKLAKKEISGEYKRLRGQDREGREADRREC